MKASVLSAVTNWSHIVLDEAQLHCVLVKFGQHAPAKQPRNPGTRVHIKLVAANYPTVGAVRQRTCLSNNNNNSELSAFKSDLRGSSSFTSHSDRAVAPINSVIMQRGI